MANDDRLLARFLAGELSPAEREEAIAMLKDSPELQRELGEQAAIDSLLGFELGKTRLSANFSASVARKISTEKSNRRQNTTVGKRKPVQKGTIRKTGPKTVRLALAQSLALRIAAAVLLFAGAIAVLYAFRGGDGSAGTQTTPESRSLVANTEAVIGVIRINSDGKTETASAGARILEGDTVAAEGDSLCRIRLTDGTVVALNRGSSVRFSRPDGGYKIDLAGGEIFLSVMPQKTQLIVTAGRAEVAVLGTELGVSLENSRTTVVVETGKVRVSGGDQPLDLAAGELAFFDKTASGREPYPWTDRRLEWMKQVGAYRNCDIFTDVAGKRYYAAEVIFEDDFSGGLDKWCFAMTPSGVSPAELKWENTSEHANCRKMTMRGETREVLRVDSKKMGDNMIFARPKSDIAEACVYECDIVAGCDKRDTYMRIFEQPVSATDTLLSKKFTYPDNVFTHVKIVNIPYVEANGDKKFEWTLYANGEPLIKQTYARIMPYDVMCTQGSGWYAISNVRIRKLLEMK